jgi:transcriptional regulator with XRE-family HTH domain
VTKKTKKAKLPPADAVVIKIMDVVEDLRKELGLSQRGISTLAGLSPTTYWAMRQHPERIYASNLFKLAKAVGIEVTF